MLQERDTDRTARHSGTATGGGDSSVRSGTGAGSSKGKRQIDDFLNEIINRQEAQGSDRSKGDSDGIYGRDREPSGGNVMSTSLNGGYIEKGSFDNGDPTTTNLYLGSLSPATTGTHY